MVDGVPASTQRQSEMGFFATDCLPVPFGTMSLHPEFPTSPYAPLIPEQRWFPADETLRSTAHDKLLPPLVAEVRQEVHAWRGRGYPGASPTSVALLRCWFETDHLLENAGGSLSSFRYYCQQGQASARRCVGERPFRLPLPADALSPVGCYFFNGCCFSNSSTV